MSNEHKGDSYSDNARGIRANTYVETINIMGLVLPKKTFTMGVMIIGAVLILVGFFAVPWANMFFTFSGFDLVTNLSGINVLTLWLLPMTAILGVVTVFLTLSNNENAQQLTVITFWLALPTFYPLIWFYIDTSSGFNNMGLNGLMGSVVEGGFWISLFGNILVLVAAFIGKRK